ncbi:MAG: formylglycine-generating enzyme family protein [Phycisphaerales bacterium JB039]
MTSPKWAAIGAIALAMPCLAQQPSGAGDLTPYTETISGTTVSFEMLPIPAGTVEIEDPETGETRQVEVGPFWMARTETTWDMYDVFVYELDTAHDEQAGGEDAAADQPADGATENGADPGASGIDAVSRPSKPYIPPDRGFGHAGYPAISLTRKGAESFCEWLSLKTGRRYRLPTPEEWIHAAGAGADSAYFFGDDPAQLAD